MRRIYLMGSLRNPGLREAGRRLRAEGHEVFDQWHTAGPEADEQWREYHKARGNTLREALVSPEAVNTFGLDMHWLQWADTAVLLLPAGRSGHMELGWFAGAASVALPGDRSTHIILDSPDPDRWDLMYKFADGLWPSLEAFMAYLGGEPHDPD